MSSRALVAVLLVACSDDVEAPPPPPPPGCPLPTDNLSVVEIRSEYESSMYALMSDGSLWCWGPDVTGMCGGGHFYHPVKSSHECLTTMDSGDSQVAVDGWGRAVGWGSFVEVKFDGRDPAEIFQPVEPLADMLFHSSELAVALDGEGRVWMWGDEQIGPDLNEFAHHEELTQIAFSGPAASVAGALSVCAILEDGDVECVGDNRNGQLGFTAGWISSPTKIEVDHVVQMEFSDLALSCVRRTNGEVLCSGLNLGGFLGLPPDVERRESFGLVDGLPPADLLRVGGSAACIVSDGAVWCWGMWPLTGESATPPTKLELFDDVVDVGVGGLGLCLVRADQSIWCNGSFDVEGRCQEQPGEWVPLSFEPCEPSGFY